MIETVHFFGLFAAHMSIVVSAIIYLKLSTPSCTSRHTCLTEQRSRWLESFWPYLLCLKTVNEEIFKNIRAQKVRTFYLYTTTIFSCHLVTQYENDFYSLVPMSVEIMITYIIYELFVLFKMLQAPVQFSLLLMMKQWSMKLYKHWWNLQNLPKCYALWRFQNTCCPKKSTIQ